MPNPPACAERARLPACFTVFPFFPSPHYVSRVPSAARGRGMFHAEVYGAPSVDVAVLALTDSLSNCLQLLVGTFGGEGLGKVLRQCKQQPVCGTAAEMEALLHRLVGGEE